MRFETLRERRREEVEPPQRCGGDGVSGEDRREVLRPVVEGGEVEGDEGAAMVEEVCKVGSRRRRRRALVPPDELNVAEVWPGEVEEVLEGDEGARVDRE